MLVEDVAGEEVSEMHARSVLVGILDPVTRQHTAVTIRSHVSPSRRSCRSSPTTRRRARKQCRLDLLMQAPLRRRQPGRHQWQRRSRRDGEEDGAVNAVGSQQCWTRQGYGHVSRDCPDGRGKGNFGEGKGAYEWEQGQPRREQGQQLRDVQGRWKGERSSRGTRTATASLEGQDPSLMASATPAMEIRTRLPQRWRKRRIQGTGSLGDLGRAATGRTRTCSLSSLREAPPKDSKCRKN